MAGYLDAIEARLRAVLESARGADGSLGATAQQYAIAAGTYRPTPDRAPLRAVTEPTLYDLAYELEWADDDDSARYARNPLDNNYPTDARLRVHLGCLAGAGRDGQAFLNGTEVAATVVLAARRRALGHARRIANALTCFDLVLGGTAPEISDARNDGPTTTEDLGDGRVLATVPLRLLLWVDATQSLVP